MTERNRLDIFDQRIVQHLRLNGRLSWRDLARLVGLSLSPTIRRVRRLERDGVIRGYHAAIGGSHVGGSIGVFVTVTLERQASVSLVEFERHALKHPEILGAYQLSGNQDYLLHASVRDVDHYQTLLSGLSAIPGILKIESKFVLKTMLAGP